MYSRVLPIVMLYALLSAAPLHAAITNTTESATVTGGPGSFSYSIGGWDGGGTVTGSFDGFDLDSNGQLSFFAGEITGFTMSYSGGSIVDPISFSFGDLFGFVYDLDGGPLGDGLTLDIEGIAAFSAGGTFLFGPGPVGECGIGEVCGFIETSSVPEPSSLALALTSLGLFVVSQRRRSI
jgi:hypothetical protein